MSTLWIPMLCPKYFFAMLQCLHMLNDCFLSYVLFVEGASPSLSLSFLFFYVILGGSGNGYVVLG